MKKIFTLLLLAMACSVNMQAQEYNLFDPADVDADGWLWFDTDEKIEKYVGVCNEDDYKVNPNGKLIQLVYNLLIFIPILSAGELDFTSITFKRPLLVTYFTVIPTPEYLPSSCAVYDA